MDNAARLAIVVVSLWSSRTTLASTSMGKSQVIGSLSCVCCRSRVGSSLSCSGNSFGSEPLVAHHGTEEGDQAVANCERKSGRHCRRRSCQLDDERHHRGAQERSDSGARSMALGEKNNKLKKGLSATATKKLNLPTSTNKYNLINKERCEVLLIHLHSTLDKDTLETCQSPLFGLCSHSLSTSKKSAQSLQRCGKSDSISQCNSTCSMDVAWRR